MGFGRTGERAAKTPVSGFFGSPRGCTWRIDRFWGVSFLSSHQITWTCGIKNPDGSFRDQGDHIQQIGEYGFDLGGPILKDKLWFYGTYGKQDIRLERLNGTRPKPTIGSSRRRDRLLPHPDPLPR